MNLYGFNSKKLAVKNETPRNSSYHDRYENELTMIKALLLIEKYLTKEFSCEASNLISKLKNH